MSEVFADDDFIPDFEWDGTGTTAEDIADAGGFVNKAGYYHLDLRDRTFIQKEGEPKFIRYMFVVEDGEHKDQIGKQCSHRLYLQKWEYELDEKGKPIEEEVQGKKGGSYKRKKKTGKVLDLEADDFARKQAIRFFVGLGLLKEEDAVGKKFKLPVSQFLPGFQCIAKVDNQGQIEFSRTYTLDNPEMEAVPKNQEALARWQAGAGVNDDLISQI